MTEEKKGVSAWLRGIIDECGVSGTQSCTAIAKAFDIDCKHERACRNCISKMMTTIADRIDAERALPEGVEWPRFEDGEMVKFGDEVEFEGEAAKVLDVAFSVVRFSLGVGTATTSGRVYGFLGEPAKRPTPKVLDADGVPIEVGDTVYCDDDPEPLQVDLIYAGSTGYCTVRLKDSAGIYTSADAPRLSHKKPEPPDSWEKLEKDARKTACAYAPAPRNEDGLTTCDGCPFLKSESCSNEMTIDLVERAKKLAGVEEEARND